MRDLAMLTLLAWLAISAGLFLLANAQSRRMFDAALKSRADALLAFSQHELDEIRMDGGGIAHEAADTIEDADGAGLRYQVWQADGHLAFRNQRAPAHPLLQKSSGFSDALIEGQPARGYAAWDGNRRYQIQAVEPVHPRSLFVAQAAGWIALTMAIAGGLYLWRLRQSLRQAFVPLNECAAALLAMAPGRPSELSSDSAPLELQPLIEAFDGMASRVQRALEHERRFTSHAAHELKTPLASLKVLLHNAQRASGETERRAALALMHEVVDRSSLLVERLLALARYDRDPGSFDLQQAVDLAGLALRTRDELQALSRARLVNVELQPAPGRPTLHGNEEALRVLLRNLMENAVQHARHGGRVLVRIEAGAAEGPVMVGVHDDGEGVPPEWASRVFAPFVRAPGTTSPGTGLGLAIAERVVELHGGRIQVRRSPELGGALVAVELPLQARPS